MLVAWLAGITSVSDTAAALSSVPVPIMLDCLAAWACMVLSKVLSKDPYHVIVPFLQRGSPSLDR
jgi:hypothetical protein